MDFAHRSFKFEATGQRWRSFHYRAWAHAIHLCLLCHIQKHQFQDLSMYNVSLNEAPWALFGAQAHVAEVARHVIQVRIESVDVRSMVLQALRHSGPTGSRYVYKDIVTLTLKAGHRLEPCEKLRDIHQFEHQDCPFDCVFWRGVKTDRITHSTPLWDIEGMSLSMFGIDMLHTWALGAMQSFVGFTFWHFLRSKVFSSGLAWLSLEEDEKIGMIQVKSEMWRYYRARRKRDPEWKAKGSEAALQHTPSFNTCCCTCCCCNWDSSQRRSNLCSSGLFPWLVARLVLLVVFRCGICR